MTTYYELWLAKVRGDDQRTLASAAVQDVLLGKPLPDPPQGISLPRWMAMVTFMRRDHVYARQRG